jgi:hypothetical protein
MFGLSFGLSLSGTTGGGGTAAFTQFGVRPYFVMDTPKNKYLTSGPERSDNLSGLMTSVALGPATTIDKGGVLKRGLHNFFEQSSDFSAAEWTASNLEDAPALQADGSYLIVPHTVDNGSHRVIASIGTVTTTDQVAVVIEVKAAGYDYIAVALAAGPFAGEVAAVWNIATGVLTATSDGSVATVEATAIKRTADGWGYEVTLKSTAGAVGGADVRIINSNDGTLNSFVGDGTSGVYIRKARAYYSSLGGMQLNSKDGTDYLPTSGAAGYALRRDYSRLPVDGQILGEPAGVNSLRNNTMQGAVVGVIGSGGALPTYWGVDNIASSAVEVIGFGTEDGAHYIDIRLNGTPTGSVRLFSENNATAIGATSGESWTYGLSLGVQSGSITNIDQAVLGFTTLTSAPALHDTYLSSAITLTSSKQAFSHSAGIDNADGSGTIAYVRPEVRLTWTSGAIDITLRIYMPQMEEYHVATSVIPTYGASEARAKDEASCIIADKIPGFIQGSGSLVFEGSIDYETGGSAFGQAFSLSDGGFGNTVIVQCRESSNSYRAEVKLEGVSQAVFNPVVLTGVNSRLAFRWADDDFAGSWDGATALTDASGTVPVGLTIAHFGGSGGPASPIRISHLSIGPYASPVSTPGWSDPQLEDISGP